MKQKCLLFFTLTEQPPTWMTHRAAIPRFDHVSDMNFISPGEHWQSATVCVSPGFFFLLHSRHAAQYVWLTACTHWPQSHSCSHPFLPCSISTYMNQTAQETQSHCRSCISVAVSKTWKPCRKIFVIFSSKVKWAWLVISLIPYFNSSLRTNHHSAHVFM